MPNMPGGRVQTEAALEKAAPTSNLGNSAHLIKVELLADLSSLVFCLPAFYIKGFGRITPIPPLVHNMAAAHAGKWTCKKNYISA